MPSLMRRSNGVFYIIFWTKGKQVWKSTRTRVPEEGQRVYEEFEVQWRRKHATTLSSFFSKFMETAPLNYAPKTIGMYSQAFSHLKRIVADKRLNLLSPLDAEEFKRVRCKEVSPVSVNIELRTLKAAFNVAVEWKLITENPFKSVKPVRVPYTEPKHLSREEFDKLLSAVRDPAFVDLIKFAVYTMTRIGELVNLKWENVDLKRRWIHVRSNGEFRVKGGKPRSVPMSEEVYQILASRSRTSEYVFTDGQGRKLNPCTISHRFRKTLRQAGLSEGIHWHSLRHTGISWLINRGVAAPFIQKIAGHSSLAVTQIYTHLEDENLHTAISAFGRITTN